MTNRLQRKCQWLKLSGSGTWLAGESRVLPNRAAICDPNEQAAAQPRGM